MKKLEVENLVTLSLKQGPETICIKASFTLGQQFRKTLLVKQNYETHFSFHSYNDDWKQRMLMLALLL